MNTMFIVSILCKPSRKWGRPAEYALFMSSGIDESKRGRFHYTPNRAKAVAFAKLTAEELVVRLKKSYGLTARVEVAEPSQKRGTL